MLPLGAEPENNVLDDNSHTATTLGSMPRTPGRNQSVRGVSVPWHSGNRLGVTDGRAQSPFSQEVAGTSRGSREACGCQQPVPSLPSPGQSRWDFA